LDQYMLDISASDQRLNCQAVRHDDHDVRHIEAARQDLDHAGVRIDLAEEGLGPVEVRVLVDGVEKLRAAVDLIQRAHGDPQQKTPRAVPAGLSKPFSVRLFYVKPNCKVNIFFRGSSGCAAQEGYLHPKGKGFCPDHQHAITACFH
jgi:hypothetical protein